MDHLPTSRHGIEHMTVQFVAGYDFDGAEFFSFPSRCDFDKLQLQESSVNSLASFVQSWLYFGILDVFFDRHIDTQTFVVNDDSSPGQQRVLSSLPLLQLLDQWLETVVIPVMDPDSSANLSQVNPIRLFKHKAKMIAFLGEVSRQLDIIEKLPQSSQHPLPTIILSARILVGTLSGFLKEVITLGEDLMTLGYVDRNGKTEQEVPLRQGSTGLEKPSPACQLLLDEFTAQGCCPFIARQIC